MGSSLLLTLAADVLKDLFTAFVNAFFKSQADQRDEAAREQGAISGAATETGNVIAEVADERSKLPPLPVDAGELVERLQRNAAAARASGRSDDHPDNAAGS